MSYTVFIQKFKEGEPAPIRFEELDQALSKYGKIENDESGLIVVSAIGDLFETASLSGDVTHGIDAITIHRPRGHKKLSNFIFDLLQFEGTCFFGQGLEFLITRQKNNNELPDDLVNACKSGLTVINSPEESWPIDY